VIEEIEDLNLIHLKLVKFFIKQN